MQRRAMITIAFVVACATVACGRVRFADHPDATAADDAPAPDALLRRCTGPVIFDDDFDVAGAGPVFGDAGDMQIGATETGGELVFDLTGPLTMDTYRGYRTLATYPLAGLCVILEVSQLPAADGASAFTKIFDTSNVAETFLYRSAGASVLAFRTHVNATDGDGTVDQGVDIAFDPALRFWRLQQLGNRTYWDVSTDGTHFVEHAQRDDLFSDSAVFIEVGAGTMLDATNAGVIAFQRITVRGP